MKKSKKIMALLMVAAVCILSGCSAKDVSTKSTKGASMYQKYINNIMECCYYGDTAKYVEVCEATTKDAEDAYYNTVDYYAYQLMVFNEIDYEYISEDMQDKFFDLAKSILAKAKFTVNEGVKVNDSWQVQVDIMPVDINDTTWDEIEDAIADYNKNIDSIDATQLTDEQAEALYTQLQEDYAQVVYDIIAGHVSTLGYKDKVSKIVIITTDEDGLYGIADDDWNDIDDIVVDMKGKV